MYEQNRCPKCGNWMDTTTTGSICRLCGHTNNIYDRYNVYKTSDSTNIKKHCMECGHLNNNKAKFCEECGTKFYT